MTVYCVNGLVSFIPPFNARPGALHGFHADYRASDRREAAEDGWNQMQAWFKKPSSPAARQGPDKNSPGAERRGCEVKIVVAPVKCGTA